MQLESICVKHVKGMFGQLPLLIQAKEAVAKPAYYSIDGNHHAGEPVQWPAMYASGSLCTNYNKDENYRIY